MSFACIADLLKPLESLGLIITSLNHFENDVVIQIKKKTPLAYILASYFTKSLVSVVNFQTNAAALLRRKLACE
jgi:hypothetical protein